MRPGLGLAIVIVVGSCSSKQAPCPAAPVPPAAVAVDEPPPAAPPAPPAPGRRCWASGRPTPPVAAKDEAPYCAPFDMRILARVEARVKKEFVVREQPSKLIIDFGCDAAYGDAKDVFFEDGSGHGGSLRLVRFRVEPDHVDVRAVGSSHYHGAGLEVVAGSVDRKTFDALLGEARVAMLARPHLVRLVDPTGGLGTMGMSGSSNDFHLRLTIVDEEGRATDRHFTGYDGSEEQETILPMRFATAPIVKLLDATKLTPAPITAADRSFFTARLIATMAGDPFWWVTERYVANAAQLGTFDAVPALVALLRAPTGASEDRTREAALDAIAAITGWDPWLDDAGARRPVAAATAAALAECVLP